MRVKYADLDDHFRYTSKDISLKILLNKDHKVLQGEGIVLLIKNFQIDNHDIAA